MAPPNTPYYKRDAAIIKMRREYFAFHTEPMKVYPQIRETYTDRETCEITEVVIFPPEYCYVALPWASPYKEATAIA
jgi:hypothetical protein